MSVSELRQTNLTFSQIRQGLESRSILSRCTLLREMGILALRGKNAEEAESYLCKCLPFESKSDEICVVFGFLSRIKYPDQETIAALRLFRNNPMNAEFVEFVDGIGSELLNVL